MQTICETEYRPNKVSGGYADRVLRIDLSKPEITIQEISPDFRDKYIGGRGYALKLIWDETARETRYDSPENSPEQANSLSARFLLSPILLLTRTLAVISVRC
jgi:hypothetical protein